MGTERVPPPAHREAFFVKHYAAGKRWTSGGKRWVVVKCGPPGPTSPHLLLESQVWMGFLSWATCVHTSAEALERQDDHQGLCSRGSPAGLGKIRSRDRAACLHFSRKRLETSSAFGPC